MSAREPSASDPTRRFSDRAADYERYRPGYPPKLIEYLRSRGALFDGAVVADVGSGTGISSALFARAGCTVHAIEPNEAMRGVAERHLGENPRFHSVAARAEATTLDDASVDLVAAGTAFHWFDRDATRREFARILRRGGFVALFWNVRSLDSPFMRDYEKLLRAHCEGYADANARERADDATLRAFFRRDYSRATFANPQPLDFESLRGRLMSSSYSPREGDPRHDATIAALRALFDTYADNGRVAMLYDTEIHLGRLDA